MGKIEGSKIEAEGRERDGIHGKGQQAPRPPKGFPLFSAFRMASPDTIILLILDYHAAIGGQDPSARLAHPLSYASILVYGTAKC